MVRTHDDIRTVRSVTSSGVSVPIGVERMRLVVCCRSCSLLELEEELELELAGVSMVVEVVVVSAVVVSVAVVGVVVVVVVYGAAEEED